MRATSRSSGALPDHPEHAALATDYAHVTAPLRRLVDRYAGEICVALCADEQVPAGCSPRSRTCRRRWRSAERTAKKYERAIIDLMEVFMIASRIDETFTGSVVEVDRDRRRGTVVLKEPAIEARVIGSDLPLGQEVSLRVASTDAEKGAVTFEVV